MDRATWLKERRSGLGSSDVAAVCGLSPWGSPLSVYLDKLGLLPEQNSPEMEWGTRLEPVIAGAYEDRKGVKLYQGELTRHPEEPYLLATPDRLRSEDFPPPWEREDAQGHIALPPVGPDGSWPLRIVELKTSSSREGWGEEGTDQVPEGYLLQVQHQMHVLGVQRADLAVLIAGNDFRIYEVAYSPDLLRLLLPILRDFWGMVQAQQPPEPDWNHPATPALVELLYRPVAGTLTSLGSYAQALVNAWESLGAQVTGLKQERERLRARIVECLGTHELGELPDGRFVSRKLVQRRGYSVPPCEYVDFRLKGKAPEGMTRGPAVEALPDVNLLPDLEADVEREIAGWTDGV